MSLTEFQIRHSKASASTLKIFDGGGLYLEVTASGSKYWRWKYYFQGKEKRLSFGVYPHVTLKIAREERESARKLLASGIDPSQERKKQKLLGAERSANTFEAVAREWWTAQSSGWIPAHSQRVLRRLERDVFPGIGARPIAELSAPEVLAILRQIESRDVHETAKRALVSIRQVFRYAIMTARADRNVATDLQGALLPIKTEHFAATTDPQKLGGILRAFDSYGGTNIVRSALRLAPLVFVRPGELRRAGWKDIDLENAEWRLTTSKTKTLLIVPLARQSVAILTELKEVTGEGRYVFPSARKRTNPMSDNAVLTAMRDLGIGQNEMTGHGFRAVARTLMDEVLNVRPDFIEHQLGHRVKDPNGRAYNRTVFLPERRQMMQTWADYLERLKTEVGAQSHR